MKEWLYLQNQLHRRVQKEIRFQGPESNPSIRKYSQAYQQDFQSLKLIDQHQFFYRLNTFDFCFFGDFHPLSQSQKFLLRLLRQPQLEKPRYIALEALRPEDEKLVKKFQARPSKKNEEELLKHLPLSEWGSSWHVYRQLFEEAKKLKIEIRGIAADSKSLKERDAFATQILSALSGRTWILFGEFHCARKHLPFQLQKLRRELTIGVVQQNVDKLSRKYLSQLSRRAPVFLRASKKYEIDLLVCLHTPLWVKWQSYLDQQILREEMESPVDAQEQCLWSLQSLVEFLKDPRYPTPVDIEDLLDLSVIETDDEDFSSSLQELPLQTRRHLIRSMEVSRVGASASDRRIYMTEKSLNACAQAAAVYLYQAWSGQSQLYKDFSSAALSECLCFFLTKILNHRRRTKSWEELRSTDSKAARLALKARELVSLPKFFHRQNSKEALLAGAYVGRILADKVFEAFLSGEFTKQRLNRLLTQAPKNSEECLERLIEIQSVGSAFDSSPTL